MKKIKFFALLAALVLPLGFAACSSDDDDDKNNNNNQEAPATDKGDTYDDLSFFQNSIVELDSTGNYRQSVAGVALYNDDPEHLYIGVDTWDEAEEWFRSFLAPDVTATTTSDGLEAKLTDEKGNAQATAYLKHSTKTTNVAEVTVSDESKLKYFTQLTFMLNSAWPENAANKSKYKLGDVLNIKISGIEWNKGAGHDCSSYKKYNEDDFDMEWVCIRKSGNGTKARFVGITKNKIYYNPFVTVWRETCFVPALSTAKSIGSNLTDNWDMYVEIFESLGRTLNTSHDYWIDHQHYSGLGVQYTDHWSYYKNDEYYGAKSDDEQYYILFKIDWLSDDEIYDGMTVSAQ